MPGGFAKDILFAARWLRRSPGFALAAVASLAIGVGFNTALFSIVDSVLLRPLPVKALDRLVDVFTSGSDGDRYATSSYPDFIDLRSQNAVFEDMTGYSPMIAALNLSDRSRLVMGEVVTGNYFSMLGVPAAIGRTILPEDDRPGAEPVVMLSDRHWRRDLGADPNAVGKSVRLRGRSYTIIGVAPRRFTGMVPILSAELWIPIVHVGEVEPAGISDSVPSPGASRLDRRGQRWMFVKGRMKQGVAPSQAESNLQSIMGRLAAIYPQSNKDRGISVLPTREVRIHPEASKLMVPAAAGLMLSVGLVLLIACANVASMLLARASARRREIAIRLAIGCSRARLVRQLLTESTLLALIGAAASLLLASWIIRLVTTLELPIPVPLSVDLRVDTRVLAFTLGIAVLAGVMAGLAPALRASRPDIIDGIRAEARTRPGARHWTLRDGLVAGQLAVTLVLLVGSGLLVRSLAAAARADVGFEPRGLAVVSADPAMLRYDEQRCRQFWELALGRVGTLPGVESAALAARVPFELNFSTANFYIPEYHGSRERSTTIHHARVSAEYLETLGIPILQGRGFSDADTPESRAVVVINETMARRFWPGGDALGKRILMRGPDGPAYEVVGVSADYRLRTVGEGPQPFVHFAWSQRPNTYQVLIARTRGDATSLLSAVRRELLALEPNLVFVNNQTMEAQVSATLLPEKAGAWIVGCMALIGMTLAAVGLYGVISYSVARRTREIGIRMALGAGRSTILALVMRRGQLVAAIGLSIGVALAFVAAKALGSILYGVSPGDPVTWSVACALLAAVAALANLIPAWRAASTDPSRAMRTE